MTPEENTRQAVRLVSEVLEWLVVWLAAERKLAANDRKALLAKLDLANRRLHGEGEPDGPPRLPGL